MREIDASHHCIYCGERLRKFFDPVPGVAPNPPFTNRPINQHNGKYGRYGDNLFCSMKCGYNYAIHVLKGGKDDESQGADD